MAAKVALVTVIATGLVSATARPAAAIPIDCETTPPIAASSGGGTYALSGNGNVWAWGKNDQGQLGRGTIGSPNPTPQRISETGPFVAISAGNGHALALKPDGGVWAWGSNEFGQLGDGTTIDRPTPFEVSGIGPAAMVRAGATFSFVILRDGTVWAWGRNQFGQLGDGTTTHRFVPTQITALSGAGIVEIEPGEQYNEEFTLARKSDGTVWSWGYNGPQLGRAGTTTVPGQVGSLSQITDLSAGASHGMARRSDGTVWTWGRNDYGQLGDGTQWTSRPTPVQVLNLTDAVEVSAGAIYSLARRSGGTVAGWGFNRNHELADGTTVDRLAPVAVGGLSSVVAIDAGGLHSVALTSGGNVRTWGLNNVGGIGNGNFTTPTSPYTTSVSQSQPPVPTAVEPTPGEALINLVWTEEPTVVLQYVITPYVAGVPQPPIVSESPATEHAVENLTPGTTYSFTVAAQNCLGTSAASSRSIAAVPTETRLGSQGSKVESQRITDRMMLHANVFNGNLNVTASDLRIAGTGLDFVLARSYNNRGSGASLFGNRWSSTVGTRRLQLLTGGSVFFHESDGAVFGFAKEDNGTYLTPAGIDGVLAFQANSPSITTDDRYVLTMRFTNEQLVFDNAGKLLQNKDRNGNTISYEYNGPGGRLSRVQDTQGRYVTLSYNAALLVGTVTDAAGRTMTYQYDPNQNLTRYRDAANKETVYSYDANGNLVTITTPAGRRVSATYDAARRVSSLSWPLATGAPTTTFTYKTDNTVVSDARGNDTTYEYDRVGRTKAVVDALGNTASLDYTSHSNVMRYTRGGGTTSYGYNSAHAPKSMVIPTGASMHADYDDGNHPALPTRTVDMQGNPLFYTYDSAGNALSQTNALPAQNRVDVTYGPRGRVATTTDPNGNVTTYGYDAAGNMTSVTPPAPLQPLGPITYDGLSRVVSIRDGNGKLTRYTYDVLDRVTRIRYGDGTTVDNAYDPDGNLVEVTDATGTVSMEYDPMGRLAGRTTPDSVATLYEYDKVGNLTKVTDAAQSTKFFYDKVNLPVRLQQPDGSSITFTHDANYNRRTTSYPNGVTVTNGYDDSGRVTSTTAVQSAETLVSRKYSYANPATGNTDAGLRYSIDDEVAGRSTRYTYDTLNRLKRARVTTSPGGALVVEYRYVYDGSGNRKQAVVDAADPQLDSFHTYSYNDANQLVQHNNETFTYDGKGNLTGSSLGASYTYDAAGRTLSIVPSPGRGTPSEHLYRGAGQAERIGSGPLARHVTTPVACGLSCVDPPDPNLATTLFRHTMLGVSSTQTGTLTTNVTRDPAGKLLGQRTPQGNDFFVTDGIGSVIAVTGSDGKVRATYDYDPFGAVVGWTGAPDVTPWRFTGAYLDATGLYKLGERYYDPAVGRFTQQDAVVSVFDPKQWNRYVYVGGDPVNFVDPSGMNAVSDWFSDRWEEVKCVAQVATTPFRLAWQAGSLLLFAPTKYAAMEALKGLAPHLPKALLKAINVMIFVEWFALSNAVARATGNKTFMDCF